MLHGGRIGRLRRSPGYQCLHERFILEPGAHHDANVPQRRFVDLAHWPGRPPRSPEHSEPRTRSITSFPTENPYSARISGEQKMKALFDKASDGEPPTPKPSASIILLSPTNQILLLHRVASSKAFPAAHVFPGGCISTFHDRPNPHDDENSDNMAYRVAAIRETFEESGILLAHPRDASPRQMLHIPPSDLTAVRQAIHHNAEPFLTWLARINAVPNTSSLVPFTRWITPIGPPARFTTQMYLFMLPLGKDTSNEVMPTPTHDGGLEHTAADWAHAGEWVARARLNEIQLFPPQMVLVSVIDKVISAVAKEDYQAQREALLRFVSARPTLEVEGQPSRKAWRHATAEIPWTDKVICPRMLMQREEDGRTVWALDEPGETMKGSRRGGDYERLVLMRFLNRGIQDVEVRWREEVQREQRGAKI